MIKSKLSKRTLVGAASLLALSMASGAALAQEKEFEIEAQPLAKALIEFNEQSGVTVAAPRALVQGKKSAAVSGAMEPDEALEKMLAGSGLELTKLPSGAYTVAEAPRVEAEPESAPFLVAELDQAADDERVETKEPEDEVSVQDKIVVTGTNIRGVNDQFSPVISLSRGDFDAAGFGSVSEMVSSLPQNFGSASVNRTGGGAFGAGASSVNLRGLGASATLTLLNGRRLAPGGLKGNAVDISSIPVSALDRVEVLTDGASAIYGSDAIAGVVNIVMRDDYEGHESRLRVGTLTDGDGDSLRFGHTFGVANDHRHFLMTYEYSKSDALDAQDREFALVESDPTDLLPDTERHSILFTGGWNLTPALKLNSDAYFNNRKSEQFKTFPPTSRDTVDVDQYGGSIGFAYDVSDSWQASASGSYSRSDFSNNNVRFPPLFDATGSVLDDTLTEVWSIDLKADGELFEMGGGAVRAVFGGQYREEKLDALSEFFDVNGEPMNFSRVDSDTQRSVSALYSEVYAPIVGEANSFWGVDSLSFSLAARYEDYDDFGSTFNPKIGAVWSPVEGVSLRGTYGTSFLAPQLESLQQDIIYGYIVDYIDPEVPSGESTAFVLSQAGNQNLDPEESTAWTVGIDFNPESIPGLEMRATYFDVEYDKRIAFVGPNFDFSDGLRAFDYPLPISRSVPSVTELQALVNRSQLGLIDLTSGSTLDDVEIFLIEGIVNTSSSSVRGLDASLNYGFSTSGSNWQVFANGSYLFAAEDQFSELTPVDVRLDTIFNPVDLRVRGGVSWSKDKVGATIAANYVDDYDDDRTIGNSIPVDSWLTFDVSGSYDFEDQALGGILAGTKLTLSATNVLDEAPPVIAFGESNGFASLYDSANSSPNGRGVSIQLTKSW